MGRKREPRYQSARIFYKEKDHRDVIMDNNYHGAIFTDEQPDPVWRRYNHRQVLGIVHHETESSWIDLVISIDVENQYFNSLKIRRPYQYPMTGYYYSHFDADDFTGLVLYNDVIAIGGLATYIEDEVAYYNAFSKNGYDWQCGLLYMNVDPYSRAYYNLLRQRYGIYMLGEYKSGANRLDLTQIKYNEGEKYAYGEPEYIGRLNQQPYLEFLQAISNELYQGSFVTQHFSQRIGSTYKHTLVLSILSGIPGELTELWSATYLQDQTNIGIWVPRLPYFVAHINNYYFYFIAERSITGSTATSIWVEKTTMMISTTGAPGTWQEVEIVQPYYTRINGQYVDVDKLYWEDTSNMFYYHDHHYYAFIYFRNEISEHEGYKLFMSEDLLSWQEINLPNYIDVPFFQDDFSTQKYGEITTAPYQAVRFSFNDIGRDAPLPPGVVHNKGGYSSNLIGLWARNRSNTFVINNYDTQAPYFEIVDGTPQLQHNLQFDDFWIFNPVDDVIVRLNYDFYNENKGVAYFIRTSGYLDQHFLEPINSDDYIFEQ